jgi:hypothetical protein
MADIVIRSSEQAQAVAKAALEISIVNDDGWHQAQAYLVTVDAIKKRLELDEEELKRPHLDELTRIREAAKPLKDLVTQRRAELAEKITAYEEARDAAARKAQAKDLKAWERQIERAETKAEQQGLPVPVTAPPPVRETVEKTQQVGDAQVTTRVTRDWRVREVIVDGMVEPIHREELTLAEAKRLGLAIPDEYWVLDCVTIGRIIRAKGQINDIWPVDNKGKVIKHQHGGRP